VYVPKADRTLGEEEWRSFVHSQRFGHMIAGGEGRDYPVVVPTQFVLEGDEAIMHFAVPNPVLNALAENPHAVMSVAGDWAFIPSAWKAIDGEDPMLGIPTTYYAAVQIRGQARIAGSNEETAAVLRRQLAVLQPDVPVADPESAHPAKLNGIRTVTLQVEDVIAKFKFGGNVDEAHRLAVVDRLRERARIGDEAAARHTERRLAAGVPDEVTGAR
jgi:transcriptional regulator